MAPPTTDVKSILKRQYRAGLAMLEQAVRSCPDDAWADGTHRNAPWQLAYHTLFFTHFYLGADPESFRPWKGHRANVQQQDGIAGPPDPNSSLPVIPDPYTKEQVLEYWRHCDGLLDSAVDALDLDRLDSGFYWYPVSKLEHQLINIRHLQHHTAQLADRVRAVADVGVRWVASRG